MRAEEAVAFLGGLNLHMMKVTLQVAAEAEAPVGVAGTMETTQPITAAVAAEGDVSHPVVTVTRA